MLRLATLVGCNYAGTENELRGCINDVRDMRMTLIIRFRFEEGDITMLTDNNDDDDDTDDDDNDTDNNDDDDALRPTGANIKRALKQMVQRAREAAVQGRGAILFFHFSGHSTFLSGGRDDMIHEAIVPCDYNLITDVDFRRLLAQLPRTATFTMVSDSSHSGRLIAQETMQIGPAALNLGDGAGRTRFISCGAVMEHLGVGYYLQQLERRMVASFGDEASALFRHPRAPVPVPRPGSGILLSGCQQNEESADGQPHGAFTHALLALLGRQDSPPTTNGQVVTQARISLLQQGYTQHPCLYCSDHNVAAPFLLDM